MGQNEVLRFLESQPDTWFTSGEICRNIGIGESSVSFSLKKLREYYLVDFRKICDPGIRYHYRLKK